MKKKGNKMSKDKYHGLAEHPEVGGSEKSRHGRERGTIDK